MPGPAGVDRDPAPAQERVRPAEPHLTHKAATLDVGVTWQPGRPEATPGLRYSKRAVWVRVSRGFDLGEISVPVEIRYGMQDVLVPAQHGRWLGEHVPAASVVAETG